MNEILNSEFWTNKMIFNVTEAFVFLLYAIAVLYLFVFAVKSVGKKVNKYEKAKKKYRFAVVFPAYKEDSVILNSVGSFFEQSYDRDYYDIIVISDRMKDETNAGLKRMGAIVLNYNFENSTKAKALQESVKYLEVNSTKRYDNIIILDADNWVDEYFLDRFNDAFYSGCSVVQSHRVSKNYNSNIAILDSVSEEINNSIFRKGHIRMGFSSSLIGSGMGFEYDLFKRIIMQVDRKTASEDKHIEKLLLKNGYYIEYLPDVYTYDEKVSHSKQFYNQRKRWIHNQFVNFIGSIWEIPKAIFNGNWDYCNKLIQWSMPPRLILLGTIIIFAVVMLFVNAFMAIKWWGLLLLLFITFAIAIPDYLCNKRLVKALVSLPLLFLLMSLNFLTAFVRVKGFIHTQHTDDNAL